VLAIIGVGAAVELTLELHRRLDRIEALLTRSLAADQAAPPADGALDEERPLDREAQRPSGRGGLRCMR
jgi:hypothetical protein